MRKYMETLEAKNTQFGTEGVVQACQNVLISEININAGDKIII